MELTIGKLMLKLRRPNALEAAAFVPLFARYSDRIAELAKMTEKMDDEAAVLTRERLMMAFFRTLDQFTQQELLKYMASLIEEWNYPEEPSQDSLSKLPPFILIPLFDAVAALTLFGDQDDLGFFIDTSEKLEEMETKES